MQCETEAKGTATATTAACSIIGIGIIRHLMRLTHLSQARHGLHNELRINTTSSHSPQLCSLAAKLKIALESRMATLRGSR